MLCLSLGLGGLLALSCASSGDQVGGYSALRPASSQQRAQARKEREARQKALAELTAQPDAGPAPEPEPEPEAPPEPVSEVEDAGVEDAAPAPSDASPEPSESPGEKLPKAADLCPKICDRVMACAQEMMKDMPPELGDSFLKGMLQQARADCLKECPEKVKDSDPEKIKAASKCLEEKDCDAFGECIRKVRGDVDGDDDDNGPGIIEDEGG